MTHVPLSDGGRRVEVGGRVTQIERRPTAVDLFQLSATLGIAHRIHYDQPYTVAEEGHRALLVQGPMQASYILQAVLVWSGAGASVASFSFRHVAPAYADGTIRCGGEVIAVDEAAGTATFSVWSENDESTKLTMGEVVVRWRL